MSEQDQSTPNPEANENATETEKTLPPMDKQAWFDAAAGVLFNKAVELANVANAEAKWLKEHSSDLLTLIDSIESDESDETATKARKQIESLKDRLLKAEQALRKYATEKAKERKEETEDTEAIKAHTETHKRAATAYKDFVRTFSTSYPDTDDASVTNASEYLPKLIRLGKSGGSTAASGGRRLRGFTEIKVNGKVASQTVNGETKSTMHIAAKDIGCELATLQNAYFEAVGSSDVEDFPHFKEFTVTHGDKTYKVEATRGGED